MNFKKILAITLATLSVFGSVVAVNAQEVEEITEEAVLTEEAELLAINEVTSGVFTYECDTSAKTAKVIAVSATAKGAAIPATVKSGSTECKIIAIADGVGSGIETLETVSFTNATNLVTIGENCFSYCPKLYSVAFNSSSKNSKITTIGNNSFYYCPKLTSVTNTAAQTKLSEIGSSVFGLTPYMDAQTDEFVMLGSVLVKYNGSKTDVVLPDGTLAVADAFFGKGITSVDLGEDLVTIGNNAFYGCRSLKSIEIPASCTKVGDMAFAGCTSLKTVEYKGGLTSIGFCSFANCSELVSFKNTGSKASKLATIGECAFWNDRKLYQLDAGVIVNVNVGSFWNCFGETPEDVELYYYRIPETVRTIAEGGYGNLWFSYVTVPASIEALASTAFGSTSGPTYVTVKGSKAEEYFKNSGYYYINYGDMDADGGIQSYDLMDIAGLIAAGIKENLNYNDGAAVIADIDGDNVITTKDLFDVFQSIKDEYEAEN